MRSVPLCRAEAGARLRKHTLEVGRVGSAARSLWLVLRHRAGINPNQRNLPALVRLEEGLECLELLAIWVRFLGRHPAVAHRQDLLHVRAAHDLGIRDGHLDDSLRVLRAHLLEKGQLRTGVFADEVGLDHVEPAGLGGVDERLRRDLRDLRHRSKR